ncbi:DUF4188 domain-containing protein [Domibacillus sp. DTU_2020_1001157_1_SI_ALB_TIR_016]|uniref:DUF4188 domain-containing protein n=1 Tax=Domibacillus sp. DTU_2020_1001157_1_SI_ALB_TIR_016 TaxID=3077789 RepID=UPI0028E287DE|nr:DUF4188 domain-containing protein [Domibacillus sp. DTU_2020_1001157_1_SI_ALB_TIR_016]WNS77747.1 DUF4188 domain-containing protein [Domibacillus sp. DTU_2020_1001157_1_SI_ALB_TIR_016]
MGKHIYPGRYTTENTEDIVVFIIGMRINKPIALNKWLPVFNAMPGMIRELYTNKDELGFLSMESYFGLRTTSMIQYWRSMDDLLAYAKNEKHLTAWANFNKKVGNNPAVGIYHETYQVKNGDYESIYGNMPHYGLGKALNHMPITTGQSSARKRLNSYKMQ